MRKSFTWFLSLMVVLIAFAIPGYAQEQQETVELYAEEASDCYNEADDYTVKISVRDFIKLNKFELDLEYNEEIFDFIGVSNVIPSLSTTTVSAAGGVISLDWSGTAATIGDNVTGGTPILVLHFSVIGYPGNVANSYASDMEWVNTSFWYDIPDGEDLVNTDRSIDGSLAVNVSLTGIETEMTSETCFGGEATIKVTAPPASMYLFNEDPNPAAWVWTNSNEYQAAAGETVTIRVKNADGCMSLKKSVVIPETIEPVAFEVSTQNPACYGAQGSVVINATGGTAPYTYYISSNSDGTGAITKTNFQFSQAPGTYYVNVQDKNDCADLEWVEIVIVDENEPIVITPTATNVLCYGGNTGSIAVSVAGGASSVSINDGISWKVLVEGTYTFTGLTAGTYKVWAKNDAGCMVSLSGIAVTQPAAPIAFNIKIDDTTCGGEEDGAITVINVMGGTAPYEYSLDGETWVTDSIFTDLLPTYYSLWVRDANECTVAYINPNGTGNTIAVQSPDDIQYIVNITDPLCNNEDATVTISNVTGGTGSYIYSFDGGATWGSTKTISWEYPYAAATIWVANADSTCPVQQIIDGEDVDNPELLLVEVNDVFAPTCIDGTDGNIHLLITGGTKPYSYSINGSSWKTSNNNLTIIKASVGTHEIMVKDANGCEWEETIEVTIDMDENVLWAESDENIDCFGDKAGTIAVYFTSWADGLVDGMPVRDGQFWVENEAGVVSAFIPSNAGGTVTTFNAGTYYVWAVDQYTCESNIDTVVVTENPELLIVDVMSNGASCFGTFEGTITVHATGGNVDGLLEYAIVNDEGSLGNIEEDRWLSFETYDPETKLSTVSFQVDGGTYWIAVRDNGCDEVTYGPIEVDGYEELLVKENQISSTDPLCYSDSTGTITVPMSAVSGGAGSYKFTLLKWVGYENGDASVLKSASINGNDWAPVTGHIGQATGVFTGLPAGVYAVLVEDAENCPSYTTEEPIVLEDPELLEMSVDYLHMSCENANDGVITVYVEGGTPGYWYAINNKNTWVAFAQDATSKTYIATEPGTFTIWVKDANGCETEGMDVTILEPTALGAEIEVDNATCNGLSNGEISIEGIGGWAGMTQYEFKVNAGGSWTSSTVITGLPAGDHILYVRDVNEYSGNYQDLDCVYAVPFTITQPTKITYEVVIEKVSCKDGADGTLTVNVLSGGTPWYIVNNIDDEGYNIRITGSDVSTEWVRTGADNSHTFTGLSHSHYTVYIEDANGCELDPTVGDHIGSSTTVESWEVNEPDTYLTFEAQWIKDATCYNAEDGQFKVMADGGTAPYKYYAGLSIPPDGGGHILVPAPGEDSDEWLDNDTLSVGAGTWVVWVMDANGCIIGGETDNNNVPVNEWRVKVEQPDSIMWAFHTVGTPPVVHYVQPSCNGSWDGVIHLVNISGGSGVYNAHVWGISAAGEAVDSMYLDIEAEGIYMLGGVPASNEDGFYVTVMDDNGCTSAVDTIYVDQPDVLTVELQQSPDNYSCFGAVEGWIEATAEGGNGDYEYELWQDGEILTPYQDIASAFLVKVGYNYTVVVKDPKGCTDTASLWMPTPLEVGFSYEDLTCSGAEKPTVTITATGTPGREFRVHYKQIEDQPANAPFITYNGWFTESITISDAFEYDNENYDDLHYAVYVEDENGCVSPTDTLTFDQVQTPLTVVVTEGEVTECTETYTIASIVGGVAPYVVMVDDTVVTEMTYTLTRGSHVVKVMDAHMCSFEETVEVAGMYVTRDTTVNTYIGEETIFIDVEAGVEDTLAVGTYEYVYMYGDCERTLNVTVVEVPRPYTIAEVQGDGDETPLNEMIVQITGTVTAVVEGEGIFVQDAVAPWSGIWVAYATTEGMEVGEGVVVVGVAGESNTVTTIMATEITAAEGTPVITPIEVTPTEAEAEMYESVLVHVPGARATAVDAGSGEWTIYYETTDNLIVNDWLYKEAAPVADNFYNVTGIVNGRADAFKLEPRMASDVTSVPTAVNPGLANTFKVYPNPFNDRILIDNSEKLTRVVVSNIAGQKVIDIDNPTREIRTANLVSGIYVISLYTENGIVKTDRMIKR